jgi:hypothetical protein
MSSLTIIWYTFDVTETKAFRGRNLIRSTRVINDKNRTKNKYNYSGCSLSYGKKYVPK